MKTCIDYLDAVKAKKHFSSDYQLAKFLGETQSRLSNYRHRNTAFDDEMAFKVAQVLGIDPVEIIIAANLQRAKRPEQKEFWQRMSKQLGAWLAAAALGVALEVGAPPVAQAAAPAPSHFQGSILCQIRRRRTRRAAACRAPGVCLARRLGALLRRAQAACRRLCSRADLEVLSRPSRIKRRVGQPTLPVVLMPGVAA